MYIYIYIYNIYTYIYSLALSQRTSRMLNYFQRYRQGWDYGLPYAYHLKLC